MKYFLVVIATIFILGCGQQSSKEPSTVKSTDAGSQENDLNWYAIQKSERLSSDGNHMVECVVSNLTPQQVMGKFKELGWTYTVSSDAGVSGDNRADAVVLKANTDKGKVTVSYVRGKKYCLSFARNFYGDNLVHDSSEFQ